MRRPRPRYDLLLVLLAGLASPRPARADKPTATAPATTPAAAPAAPGGEGPVEVEREIDIANIVSSVAKGATTVQEAPAIITIITGEEIKQRGFRDLSQLIGMVPGWIDMRAEGQQVTLTQVRGAVQAVLFLRDGVSMFDPQFNVPTMSRAIPLEAIKRIEVVTGPGGVLWGSNSFLGIVNVITKDGDDVNGLEVNAGYGDGGGNAQNFRAYAMFGRTFFREKENQLKLFLHASYENYIGMIATQRQSVAESPAPQPPALVYMSTGDVTSDIKRSWILNLDGKVSYGPLSLYFNIPFGEMNYGLTFDNVVVTRDVYKDLMGKEQLVPSSDRTTWTFFDRYGVLEYRDRFLKKKVGLNAKAFYIQFNRAHLLRVFPASETLPGGLTFENDNSLVQRFGGTLDVDYTGPWSWNRVLVGGEVFHERADTRYAHFLQPSDPSAGMAPPALLPLTCPVESMGVLVPDCKVVFAGAAERTVAGLFIADQIKPFSRLTLDGGVRYQQGFGKRGYSPQILGSAAAVWQFLPDFHLKLNWSQGFRPPVFNNTDGNGAAVQFAGNPKLEVEQSQSFSGEINARLLRNKKNVRELQLRLDYAYTLLDNLIVVRNGQYQNAGRRAINSVEFLAKLYLVGDHALTVGYTFLQVASSDAGEITGTPRHFFTVGAVFNLIRDMLDVNANLNVFGASDDPNRYATSMTNLLGGQAVLVNRVADLTYDRLSPVALLQLGARLRLFKQQLSASAQFYNVLNQRYYFPDPFFDQSPTLETRPNLAPGFSFFASITYRPYTYKP